MKICGGRMDMDAKFALNPSVSPFIPRSVISKSVHQNVLNMLDACDIFNEACDEAYAGWSFSRLCGLDLPSENGEKLLGSCEAEFFRQARVEPAGSGKPRCQLPNAALETKAQSQSVGGISTSSMYGDMLTNVITTAAETVGIPQQNHIGASQIRYPGGGKILDGKWAKTTQANDSLAFSSSSQDSLSFPCNTSSHANFTSSGLSCSPFISTIDMFNTIDQISSKSGNEGCYTLFGNDNSDGAFGCSPPKAGPPQAVITEKSYSLWGSNDEKSDYRNNDDYNFWKKIETSAVAAKDTPALPHKQVDQPINTRGDVGRQSSRLDIDGNGWLDLPYLLKNLGNEVNNRDYIPVRSEPKASHIPVRNCDENQPPHLMGHSINAFGMKTDDCITNSHLPAGMPSILIKPIGEPQVQTLSAEQQFFLSELERLPPLLRQQYLDFMNAKQQLTALSAFPYHYAGPIQPVGAMCRADFASLSVPQVYPKSKTVQPVLLMSKPVQSYGVSLPVFTVPSQIQQSAKTVKRTGPANELHAKLEDCYEQFRLLENERKKTEAELARQNPGKMISSDNDCPLPQLPHNPSRIDRLVVDSMREYARVFRLVTKMSALRGGELSELVTDCLANWMESTSAVESCRKEEIINAINRHRTKNVTPAQKETDVIALASSLKNLADNLRCARSALWCSLQLASNDLPLKCVDAAKHYAERRVNPHPAIDRPTTAWEFPIVKSSAQPRNAPNSFITRFVDEYEDDVFTDTEEELNTTGQDFNEA